MFWETQHKQNRKQGATVETNQKETSNNTSITDPKQKNPTHGDRLYPRDFRSDPLFSSTDSSQPDLSLSLSVLSPCSPSSFLFFFPLPSFKTEKKFPLPRLLPSLLSSLSHLLSARASFTSDCPSLPLSSLPSCQLSDTYSLCRPLSATLASLCLFLSPAPSLSLELSALSPASPYGLFFSSHEPFGPPSRVSKLGLFLPRVQARSLALQPIPARSLLWPKPGPLCRRREMGFRAY